MHIKRFEAPTLAEAIQLVKQELGPEALVLSHRSVRRDHGWFGWLGRPLVEVVAGIDREPVAPRAATSVGPDASWQGLALTKALMDPLETEIRSLRDSLDALRSGEGVGPLRGEIAELRDTLRELRQQVQAGEPGAAAPLVSRLEAAGFSRRHARALAAEAERRGRALEGRPESGPGGPPPSLRRILGERLDARMPPPRPDDPATVSLLVGATGVGKTTTLAKLAARQSEQADDVALLTTDTYRVGADEQLRVFARRLGVRFEVATSADDLSRRVERLGRRRIWIDTAGRGRGDPTAIPELLRYREALGPRAKVDLVVSATTAEGTLRAERERFEALQPDRLIVTKVDEAEQLSNVANLLLDEATPPLSWLATGQRVPEDLEVPDPDRLAVRMLGVAG